MVNFYQERIKKRLLNVSVFLFCALFIFSCSQKRHIKLNQVDVNGSSRKFRPKYNESYPVFFDLIHTKLDVKPLWDIKQIEGVVNLTMKAHFYPQNQVVLDAKYMNIHQVKLKGGATLQYDYLDSLRLIIHLPRIYNRDEILELSIEYTANPEEVVQESSQAIREAKGAYFINADGKDPFRMRQLWTQGETESSSCWFPTIDKLGQKTTQEISITVDSNFSTLSNGILVSKTYNKGGTRTDYWKLDKPHAPYLFMMAVGTFKYHEDKWNNISLKYWTDTHFHNAAPKVFKVTSEMLSFYSNRFSVAYPWPKYDQVVVHDFVSGAMENTTAVVHGDFVARTEKELIDGNKNEYIIAHELVHHWFGDLVTAESWSNLSLNESFADFGELLWSEYKYGKDELAYVLEKHKNKYLSESESKNEHLIRFDYKSREDMFDRHTYSKGGVILNMLRNTVGDEAFFEAIKMYLLNYKYGFAEAHQLRIEFEKVTGQDLNWFFNQWYYDKGHPKLYISYRYDSLKNIQSVKVNQKQDYNKYPVYRLPLKIALYYKDGKKEVKDIVIDSLNQTFYFNLDKKPVFVNFDDDKYLLCQKIDRHSYDEWKFLYKTSEKYQDKKDALKAIFNEKQDHGFVFENFLNQHKGIQRYILRNIKNIKAHTTINLDSILNKSINEAKNTSVRAYSAQQLGEFFTNKDKSLKILYTAFNTDSSLTVKASCIRAMSQINDTFALKCASEITQFYNHQPLYSAVGSVFIKAKVKDKSLFFEQGLKEMKRSMDRISVFSDWIDYTSKFDEDTVKETELDKMIKYYAFVYQSWQKKRLLTGFFNLLDSIEDETTSMKVKHKLTALVKQEKKESFRKEFESYIK